MAQGAVATVVETLPVFPLTALVVAGTSVLVVRRLLGRPLTADLRDRFVLGLPWGTLVTAAGLLLVYAVVQGGWEYPFDPMVIPFRTWGYDYLLGTVFAAFTHNGWGHLTNNVTSTLVFAGVAEYAWSHYPRERGASTFGTLRTNPYARILAVPAFAVVVGLLTSLTGLGPLIGFSGVVFAFAGFAIVQAPIAATLGLAGVRIFDLLLSTVRYPVVERGISRGVFSPWWADVAIQTHGVGVVLGLLAGIGLAWYRDEWSNPLYVWFAALVFAIAQGMWAVFMPLSGSSWLLFRWLGTALVFTLAALAAVGAYRTDRPLVGRIDRPLLGRVDLQRRHLAVGLLIVGLGGMALFAVPFHLAPVGEEPAPNGVVEIEGYTVGYGENVEQGYVSAVDFPFFEIPSVEASGVIVTNEQRNIWRLAIPKETLSGRGWGRVLVGGLGWRETVYADWSGWSVRGNHSVYKVFLRQEDAGWRRAYTAEPSTSSVVVAGFNLTIAPASDGFTIAASSANRTFGPVAIPENGSSVTLGPVTVERQERRLIARHDGTRVAFAQRTEKARSEDR